MDTAMRDLERIQERDDDQDTRRLVAWALAVLTTLAVVLSVVAVVGAATGEASNAPLAEDPLLLALAGDGAAGVPPAGRGEAVAAAATDAEDPPLDPASLRFPDALTETDERPEVAAALAAAAAELSHPVDDGPTPADALRAAGLGSAEPPPLPRTLPAAVAAGEPDDELDRSVRTDPLLAPALAGDGATPASPGREGEYTLQVVSYDTSERAEAFAEELRARGHRAFVRSAEVPGRGRYWRVRIGPFDRLVDAETYRRRFEADEQIATFVVRRKD